MKSQSECQIDLRFYYNLYDIRELNVKPRSKRPQKRNKIKTHRMECIHSLAKTKVIPNILLLLFAALCYYFIVVLNEKKNFI